MEPGHGPALLRRPTFTPHTAKARSHVGNGPSSSENAIKRGAETAPRTPGQEERQRPPKSGPYAAPPLAMRRKMISFMISLVPP